MKIAITGATGFIGRHVRNMLSSTNHDVVVVLRDVRRLIEKFAREKIVLADISHPRGDWYELFGKPDVVLHLAWGGLPNFMDTDHIDIELPMQSKFLTALVSSGLKKLVVSGTCYEYGLLIGALSEEQESCPNTPYGIAKDQLRKELFALRSAHNFDLTWARIFYPYGEGQSEQSLYTQLKKAVLQNQEFLMGSGRQVLDFIHVEKVSNALLLFVTAQNCVGIFNVGSGKPQSVADFVQDQIQNLKSDIIPRLGMVRDREYEPVSFWSDNSRFDSLFNLVN